MFASMLQEDLEPETSEGCLDMGCTAGSQQKSNFWWVFNWDRQIKCISCAASSILCPEACMRAGSTVMKASSKTGAVPLAVQITNRRSRKAGSKCSSISAAFFLLVTRLHQAFIM
jgi:hypothetical protein